MCVNQVELSTHCRVAYLCLITFPQGIQYLGKEALHVGSDVCRATFVGNAPESATSFFLGHNAIPNSGYLGSSYDTKKTGFSYLVVSVTFAATKVV